MRFLTVFFSLLLVLSGCVRERQEQQGRQQATPAPDSIAAHIAFLASDQMKGRGTGTEEIRRAAAYIAARFQDYGLRPGGTTGFFQPFTAKISHAEAADSVREARNIIGFLDNRAPYTIIIGAHYDHLGQGRQGSSNAPRPEGKIHNGADDNASGIAGLLELARYFSSGTVREPFNFLFIAFSAEELGLLGSKYFTRHPTIPLGAVNFMVNMDMIGRYDPERGVGIGGYGTSPSWPQVFEGVGGSVKFFTDPAGSGGSDHASFYAAGLPVLFFHTGGHPDYHMPGDDIEKVDVQSEAAILEIAIQLLENAMELPKLEFRRTEG